MTEIVLWGSFGLAEVNPWITLFAVDLPCLAALVVFRVRHGEIFEWPALPRFAATVAVGVLVLGVAGPVLAFNEAARVSLRYEVLEPGEWVGKKLPILEQIDIGERLRAGNWLVLLYHYDCPGCAEAIPMYEQMARNLAGNGGRAFLDSRLRGNDKGGGSNKGGRVFQP